MFTFGQLSSDQLLKRIPAEEDKRTFQFALDIGENSCFVTRVLLMYCLPTLECTSFGIRLDHPDGPVQLDGVNIAMVMTALSSSSAEKTINQCLRNVSVPDEDWRKCKFVTDYCKVVIKKDSGQAKILFSTIVPCARIDETNGKILVVGSGGTGGAGASYSIVARALTLEGKFGEFFLYDKFQEGKDEKIGNFIMHGYDRYYIPGDVGSDAGILIDDSYVKGAVSYKDTNTTAGVKSLKSFGEGEDQPNYSGTEKRVYVGCPLPNNMHVMPGMDTCVDCVLWARALSSFKYSTAEYLWHSAIRLGLSPCSAYDGAKLAAQVGKFDSHVRRVGTFDLNTNRDLDIGYLAISAAVNMRAGSMMAHKNKLHWCQHQYSVINAFRAKVSHQNPRAEFDHTYDLSGLVPEGRSVAVVALNPREYFPVSYQFVIPEIADVVLSSNTLIFDELSPLYLIIKGDGNKIIDRYKIDEVQKYDGICFSRYVRLTVRRLSFSSPTVTWNDVESSTVPLESLNLVINSISAILSNQPLPPGYINFSKTRDELVRGLVLVLAQQKSGKGPRRLNCGDINCQCNILGAKKPWHVSCSDRSLRRSRCGDTPCFCVSLGPKSFAHVSCSNRSLKKICGMIGCRCLYLGPNVKGVVCNRRLE